MPESVQIRDLNRLAFGVDVVGRRVRDEE